MLYHSMNIRISELKERKRRKTKIEGMINHLENELMKEKDNKLRYQESLEKENADVEKLEQMTVLNLFYTFLGRKGEKLDKEKEEAVRAKFQYDESVRTLQDLRKDLADLKQELQTYGDVRSEYQKLLKEKEEFIHQNGNSSLSRELLDMSDKQSDTETLLREVKEAVQEGNTVLTILDQTLDSLYKAKNWGTFDMLGGGMISTMVKHNHIDDARDLMHDAQYHLKRFEKELQDVDEHELEIFYSSGLLKVADFFFDGLLVDWMVQGRINESLDQVQTQRNQVSTIISDLMEKERQLTSELEELLVNRKKLIESF